MYLLKTPTPMFDFRPIILQIESKKCPVHKVHPAVKLEDDNQAIAITACCSEFKNKCAQVFNEWLSRQVNKEFLKTLNNTKSRSS